MPEESTSSTRSTIIPEKNPPVTIVYKEIYQVTEEMAQEVPCIQQSGGAGEPKALH